MSNEPRKTIGKGKNFNKANDSGTGAAAGGGALHRLPREVVPPLVLRAADGDAGPRRCRRAG